MPEVHAILSASSSKRWLNCTPSARLEQNFPNESSVYAEEGTAAHALGEYKLRKYLHERVKRPTSEYKDEEMEANTDIYAEFIISTVERIKETCPHPLVMVNIINLRLDITHLYYPAKNSFQKGRLKRREIFTELLLYTLTT